jgi:hypothetical protein
MSSYDPQRNRPRQRPKDDEPAPVDALLGDEPAPVTEPAPAAEPAPGADAPAAELSAAERAAVPATATPPNAPPEVHVHGDDCVHDELAIGPILAAIGAAVSGLLAWRWRRRRRRSAD